MIRRLYQGKALLGRRGFTLIELMVVIAIIGLLASIISISLVSSKAKSRDGKRVADIRTIQLALETYYNDNSVYPNTLASLATYLPSIPNDPKDNVTGYFYSAYNLTASSGGSNLCGPASYPRVKYHLGAALESDDTTNQALKQDNDFVAGATYTLCNLSGADFNGNATACAGSSAALRDPCYDVTN